MKHKENKEKYKIKVNRLTSENERHYPYSNYLGNEYSHFKKRVPNNSILYQLKFKPDIIINEYHQTSNNINTNINIKTNRSQNPNIDNTRNNNSNSQPNNDNRLFKNERKSDPLYKYNNNSERNINDKSDNNNSEIFSPFSNKNSVNSRDTNYKKRNINYIEDLNRNIYQTPINDTKNNKNIHINSVDYGNDKNSNFSGTENNPINNNISYHRRNVVKSNSNNSQDMINLSNALNYQNYNIRRNNLSIGSYYHNKTNSERSESSVESLRTKKMREMNDIIFSSGNKINTIFSNRLKRKNNNNLITNYNNSNNSKDLSTNVKLEYYRIKLFKEFLKHFQLFYKSYIQKYFIFFLNKIKSHKKYHKRYQNSLIYNKKSYLRNISTIEGNAQSQRNIFNNNNNKYGLNLIEVFKSSTMNDYYKMYNQLKKNKSINPRLRVFNNSSNNLNNLSTSSKSNHYINSAPRINRNENNLSVRRDEGNKSLFNVNSKSPSFRFGNKTYINNDISFANEGNQKENELYRDSKELNKKYEQIQRRKKILEMKRMNRETNKSVDIDHMKKSDEFNGLKEYMHNVNSENILKENIKNARVTGRNAKNKLKNDQLIKISSYDENLNDNDENNKKEKERKYNLNFSKTYYSYQFRNEKSNNDNKDNKNKDKDINIKSDYNREGRTGMLRKNKSRFNSKKNFLNIKTDENKNQKLIKDKTNTNINTSNTTNNLNNDKNEEKNHQKVKVNINLRLMNNNKENNITKNKTDINKNNTSNKNNKIINYNYPIPTNSKNNSPTKNKNNIYYSKNSKINFTSTLIKNIMTKDKRIYINIYYYTFSKKNNFIRKRFRNLCKSQNISITLLAVEQKKNKLTNLKLILSSIKEEDLSNQNSKIFDESGTFGGNNTNTYENRKNCIHYNLNEKIYKQFIDIIKKLIINKYKPDFFDKIKSINNDNKINNNKNYYDQNIEKGGYKRIYRKRGIVNNKLADEKNNINNKRGNISVIYNSKRKYEYKIRKFRAKLIRFILG